MKVWHSMLAMSVGLALANDLYATGLVASVSGKAFVKPSNGSAYLAVRAGAEVEDGDTIRLDPGASVVLMCSGYDRRTLRDAVQVVTCSAVGNTLFVWGNRELPAPRSVRRLLLPAGTVVQSDRPSIRWTRTAGATVRVVLRGADRTWERVVPDTGELVYPADEKQLARGNAYRFIILDPTDVSTLSAGSLNSGFKVQSQSDASALDGVLGAVAADRTLSEAERTHVSARVRLLAGLNAEAIAYLEAATDRDIGDATATTLLGRAWLQTGCVACALPVLEKAYSLAKTTGREANYAEAGRLLAAAYHGSKRNADAARIDAELASWMAQWKE